MGIRIYLIISLLITGVMASAQDIVVYHITGNAIIKEGTAKAPAVKGSLISKTGTLELKEGSTCMLIGQKGASVQIDKAGSYTYSRIMQLISITKTQSVSAKFFAYVYDNLVYKKEKTALNVTPVVYRAEPLMKSPKQYGYSTPESIVFTWRQTALKSPVRFQLLSYNDSILLDTIFKKEQLSFDLSSKTFPLQPGQIYKWNVEDQYNGAKIKVFYFFVVLHKKESVSYEKAWRTIDTSSYPREVRLSLQHDLLRKAYSVNLIENCKAF